MTIPLLWPREGVSGRNLAASLRNVLNNAYNVPMPTDDPVAAYIRWASESVTNLRAWLRIEDVDRLVRTPTYWSALAMPFGAHSGSRIVQDEMMARRQELERSIVSIEQFDRRFDDRPAMTLVVPDTNVLLEHPKQLAEADWHDLAAEHAQPTDEVRVVIPLLVVDELDNAKRVKRTERRARAALKTIYSHFGASPNALTILQEQTSERGCVNLEVLMEAPTNIRLPRPDDELIRTTHRLSSFLAQPVVFATYDTGAALRASVAGLPHVRLKHGPED